MCVWRTVFGGLCLADSGLRVQDMSGEEDEDGDNEGVMEGTTE